MLSHAPTWDLHALAWAVKISPNLIHFKAHPRGFHLGGGINWTSGDIKKVFFFKAEKEEKRRLECKA